MPKKIVKMKKAFTLIELLVVIAILGILSGTGIVAYNGYTAFAKENATKNNHKAIVNNMENEFAKCKLDKDSKIFETHPCNSSSRPSTNTISNYANTKLGLKNPYDNTLPVVQSNICTSGSVSIVEKEIGNYDVAYASVKKQTKYNSLVSSGWSSNYSKTTSTSVSFSCAQTASASTNTSVSTTPPGSFATYAVPENCPTKNCLGAYIKVDKDGKMTGDYSGGAVMEKDVAQSWSKADYKWLLVNPADSTGNVYSACANRACSYNFSNNSYNVGSVVYDPLTGKPK